MKTCNGAIINKQTNKQTVKDNFCHSVKSTTSLHGNHIHQDSDPFRRESWSVSTLARSWLAMEALCSLWRREATSRLVPGPPSPLQSTPKQVGWFSNCMVVYSNDPLWCPMQSKMIAMLTFWWFCICVLKWDSCTGSSWGPGPMSCRPSPSMLATTNWRTEATSSPSQWV